MASAPPVTSELLQQVDRLDDQLNELFAKTQGKSSDVVVATQRASDDKNRDMVLEAANASGKVATHTAIGQMSDRFLANNEDQAAAYKALPKKPTSLRADFRKRWLEETYARYEKSRTYSETLSETDLSWGTYEPFDVVVRHESGLAVTSKSLRAAYNLAISCIKL